MAAKSRPGRKGSAPSTADVFGSLYPATQQLEITDRELLEYIGGLVRDDGRRSKVKQLRASVAGTPESLENWLMRHSLVMPWLESHGWSIADAMRANAEWKARQAAIGNALDKAIDPQAVLDKLASYPHFSSGSSDDDSNDDSNRLVAGHSVFDAVEALRRPWPGGGFPPDVVRAWTLLKRLSKKPGVEEERLEAAAETFRQRLTAAISNSQHKTNSPAEQTPANRAGGDSSPFIDAPAGRMAICPTCEKPAPVDEDNSLRCPDCGNYQGKFGELWIDLKTQGRLSKGGGGDNTLCELRHLMRERFGACDVAGLEALSDWLVAVHGIPREQVFVVKRTRLVELLTNELTKQPTEPLPNRVKSAAETEGETGRVKSAKIRKPRGRRKSDPETIQQESELAAERERADLEPAAAFHRPKKAKRSTERGEAQVKLISALTKHHKYADGSCMNLEPIGNNELARRARVDRSTASAFFKRQFKGHAKYKVACADAVHLTTALKLLNNEFSPHLLYGGKPPEKRERDEE